MRMQTVQQKVKNWEKICQKITRLFQKNVKRCELPTDHKSSASANVKIKEAEFELSKTSFGPRMQNT